MTQGSNSEGSYRGNNSYTKKYSLVGSFRRPNWEWKTKTHLVYSTSRLGSVLIRGAGKQINQMTRSAQRPDPKTSSR